MNNTDYMNRIAHFIDQVVMPRSNPLPYVPENLRGDYNQDDWYSWIAVPSTIQESELDALAKRAEFRFPPLFRGYYLYKQILDGDYGIVRLPEMKPENPLLELKLQFEAYFECDCFKKNALVPFAQDGNDGGPICFKIDQPTPDGDFPIYFTDHGLLDQPNYCGEKRWDSFAQLIDIIEADILSYD